MTVAVSIDERDCLPVNLNTSTEYDVLCFTSFISFIELNRFKIHTIPSFRTSLRNKEDNIRKKRARKKRHFQPEYFLSRPAALFRGRRGRAKVKKCLQDSLPTMRRRDATGGRFETLDLRRALPMKFKVRATRSE